MVSTEESRAAVRHLIEAAKGVCAPDELRELAAWYRALAERAGNPAIWEARLQTAEGLAAEADRLEAELPPVNG